MKALFIFICALLTLGLFVTGCKSPTEIDPHYIKIIPEFYSGATGIMPDGSLEGFSSTVQTTYSDNQIYEFWDYGDGTTDDFVAGMRYHIFPNLGSYLLKVQVYKKDGTYVGSDTARITINFPNVSVPDIKNMRRMEVMLYLDSSFSIDSLKSWSIVGLRIDTMESPNSNFIWQGNNFSIAGKRTLYGDNQNFSVSGTLSNDGKSIENIKVFLQGSSGQYSYSIKEIGLLSITSANNTYFDYMYKDEDSLHNYLQNMEFFGQTSTEEGDWNNFINFENPRRSQAIFVFSNR